MSKVCHRGGKLLGMVIKIRGHEKTNGLTVVPYEIISDNDDGYLYNCVIVKGCLLSGESVGTKFCTGLDFYGNGHDGFGLGYDIIECKFEM